MTHPFAILKDLSVLHIFQTQIDLDDALSLLIFNPAFLAMLLALSVGWLWCLTCVGLRLVSLFWAVWVHFLKYMLVHCYSRWRGNWGQVNISQNTWVEMTNIT